MYNCDDQSLIHKIISVYPKVRNGMFCRQKRCNETQISNDHNNNDNNNNKNKNVVHQKFKG